MASIDTDILRRIAEITRLVKDKNREIDALKDEKKDLEAEALAMMGDAGIASVKVTDGERDQVVYLKSTTWATHLIGPDETAAALKAAGYGHMVSEKANLNSVSALVRELQDSPDGLPEEFDGIIGAVDKQEIGVRLD